MEERERQGVSIDVCRRCRGVFLDRGELEKLIALADPADLRGAQPERFDGPAATRDPEDDDSERRGRRKRRGGLLDVLGDLFD